MRYILVHGYRDIGAGTVWDAIQREIPELKRHIPSLLNTLDEQTSSRVQGGAEPVARMNWPNLLVR